MKIFKSLIILNRKVIYWVTVMLSIVMLVTLWWCLTLDVGGRIIMLATKILNRSPTSQTCHQHIWSPISVTNIDVTSMYRVLDPRCNKSEMPNLIEIGKFVIILKLYSFKITVTNVYNWNQLLINFWIVWFRKKMINLKCMEFIESKTVFRNLIENTTKKL